MKYIQHSQGPWKKHKYIRKEGTKYIYNNPNYRPADYSGPYDTKPENEEESKASNEQYEKVRNSSGFADLLRRIALYAGMGMSPENKEIALQQLGKERQEMLDKAKEDGILSLRRKKDREKTIAKANEEHYYDSKTGKRVEDPAKAHAQAMAAESEAEAKAAVKRERERQLELQKYRKKRGAH